MVAKVAEITTVAGETVTRQNAVMEGLARSMRQALDASLKVVLPVIKRAVIAFIRRPDQIARREELAELRGDWIRSKMEEWRDRDQQAYPMSAYYGGNDWNAAVRARDERSTKAEVEIRGQAGKVSSRELRTIEAERQRAELEMRQQYRPGPRMGM
jgi:hypothetical protein